MLADAAGKWRAWATGLVVACLFVTLSPSLLAQSNETGALTGRVTDPSGSPVAFAMVSVTSTDTGRVWPAATGTDGVYQFRLPPGDHRMSCESPGYTTAQVPTGRRS